MTASPDTDTSAFDPSISMARQSLYRFAALSLLDPMAGAWEKLDAMRHTPLLSQAAACIRELPQAEPQQLGPGERGLSELDSSCILARLPESAAALNREYENTFGILVSTRCPPYETEYIDSKFAFQRSHALADISGFYRAFGLTLSDDHPDRPDHIVLELEFMAFLLGLQRRAYDDAVRDGRAAQADSNSRFREQMEVCLLAQARFMREHLAWWVPAFARLLGRENPHGFYGAVAVFLSSLVPAERALLGVEAPVQCAAPSQLEPPEACEGCQLASG